MDGTEEYCFISKNDLSNNSDGSDCHYKTSLKCDAVTLPICDSCHFADSDCWHVVCSRECASSNVIFSFDSSACSSSDSIIHKVHFYDTEWQKRKLVTEIFPIRLWLFIFHCLVGQYTALWNSTK